MNIKVLYHSSTGNTKKLARAIAAAAGTDALPIGGEPRTINAPVDLLFIGDGIYAGKPNKDTIALIDSLDPATIKHAAVFATCGGQTKIGDILRGLLEQKGIKVIDSFTCKGQSWFFLNRHHPGREELTAASDFARKAIAKVSH